MEYLNIMKIPQKDTVIQFLKFGMVGVSNTAISLLIYYFFLWLSEELYLVGSIVGWIVSVANSFFWNNKFVFSNQDNSWKSTITKLGRTYLSYGTTFLVGIVLLYIEVDVLNWSAALCPIVNLLITIPANYLLNKFWTFR